MNITKVSMKKVPKISQRDVFGLARKSKDLFPVFRPSKSLQFWNEKVTKMERFFVFPAQRSIRVPFLSIDVIFIGRSRYYTYII